MRTCMQTRRSCGAVGGGRRCCSGRQPATLGVPGWLGLARICWNALQLWARAPVRGPCTRRLVAVHSQKPESASNTQPPAAEPISVKDEDGGVAAAARRAQQAQVTGKPKRQAESTDAIASFLTRRFGIAGGLAWLGFLAVGSLGEQVKTRMEVANEVAGTVDVEGAAEVVLPSGVRYTDLRVGGGQAPPKGFLVVVDYVGKANGQVFGDTHEQGRPIVFTFGSRLSSGMCPGTEQVLATMKAGGRRRVFVPASMGFGSAGTSLKAGGVVPPDADLEYDLELLRVSIPPS
ncbi:hypothetical protein FOA52_014245 [Chlamydomonas sp. UWO 241]|nr:hypothetical protein FOA52_014245 [Chlamydomonas sp. UWO 241]